MSPAGSGDLAEARRVVGKHCPAATEDEVTRLVDRYAARKGIANLPGWIEYKARTGGLGNDLAEIRASDRAQVVKRAREAAERQPECPHGKPGGLVPHPETGLPWCPQCRREAVARGERPVPSAGVTEDGPEEGEEPVRLAAIPAYPAVALCGPLADLVSSTSLPAALVGGAGLAALAGVCGQADLRMPDRSLQRPTVWVPLIGARGAGKTPALDLALGLLRELDADSHAKYRQAVEAWHRNREDNRPADPTRRIDDATLESVARWLARGDGTGLVDTDELSGWLQSIGQYKKRNGEHGRYLAIWALQPWRYQRVVNDIDLMIPRPVLPIVGGLQPHLHYLLGEEGTGFRPRWLPHIAPPGSPEWSKRRHEPQHWEAAVRKLYEYRERREWQLKNGALALWERASAGWKERARGTESAAVSAALVKADIQCARIALIIAESMQPGTGGALPVEAMTCAIAVTGYVMECWRTLPEQHAFALSARDDRLNRTVDALGSWLENRRDRCATRREIQRANVAGVRSAEALDILLAEYGKVYPGHVVSGRTGSRGPASVIVYAPAREGAPGPPVALPFPAGSYEGQTVGLTVLPLYNLPALRGITAGHALWQGTVGLPDSSLPDSFDPTVPGGRWETSGPPRSRPGRVRWRRLDRRPARDRTCRCVRLWP